MSEHDMQKSIIAECDLRANQDPRWGLLDVLPCHAIDCVTHSFSVNTIVSGELRDCFAKSVFLSNSWDLVWRKFGTRMSAFFGHVGHIVGLSAKKEMVGVATVTIVALMANFHALWNRAVVNFVAYALREARASGIVHTSSGLDSTAFPFPAIIRGALDYTCPKSFCKRAFLDRWQWAEGAVMTMYESFGLTYEPARFGTVAVCQWRIITASTLTLAVRLQQSAFGNPRSICGYVVGKVWSIIGAHKKSPFLCLIRERSRGAARCFAFSTRSIIA